MTATFTTKREAAGPDDHSFMSNHLRMLEFTKHIIDTPPSMIRSPATGENVKVDILRT